MKTVSLYKQVLDNEKSIINRFCQMVTDARANKIEWRDQDFYRIQCYLNAKLDRAYRDFTELYNAPENIKSKFWRLIFGVTEDAKIPVVFDRLGALVLIDENTPEPEPELYLDIYDTLIGLGNGVKLYAAYNAPLAIVLRNRILFASSDSPYLNNPNQSQTRQSYRRQMLQSFVYRAVSYYGVRAECVDQSSIDAFCPIHENATVRV